MSARAIRIRAFNFCSVPLRSELIVAPVGMNSEFTAPLKSQKAVIMAFPAEGVALNFFGAGEFLWRYSIHCLVSKFEVLHSAFVPG
jgi:hypothetical protein